jgi:lysozyme family protein
MDIIDKIIQREGGSKATNDPSDKGGRTQYGIAEKSNPEAWRDNRVDYAEAREIYRRKYISPFEFLSDNPAFEQAVDFGVTSGPRLAIQKIQEILGVEVDGIAGPETREALKKNPDINNKLVASRIKMIGRIVQRDPSQLKFLSGWLNRSLEFLK